MNQAISIVVFYPVGAGDVLKIELSERQIVVIHFALQAIEQAHKKKPAFLTRKGISLTEIEELKSTLEGCGELRQQQEHYR